MKNLTPQMSTTDFFRAVLPPFGTKLNAAFNKPRWISGMKFWLYKDYLHPTSGSYYYEGLRFTDNLIIYEKICDWGKGQWTYLDELSMFMFDGRQAHIIDKRQYTKTYRNEETVRQEMDDMIQNYLKCQAKLHNQSLDLKELQGVSKACVDRSFKDFLDDDYEIKLTHIIPLIELHQ